MELSIFNIANDDVISSTVGLGQSDYSFALEKVYPLINRFEAQRKFLDSRFYERLERDILKGCLMPPLTLAFVETEEKIETIDQLTEYVNKKIEHGYILDGIQRLNTLERASKYEGFNSRKEIYYNVIIADNKDKLLYRMITLNNGQKGMTPRHQIEILTQELFDFEGMNIKVQTEKQKSEDAIPDAFSLATISRGYIAFLTAHVHNENSKIIEEKMDQILIGRILDVDLSAYTLQFSEVIAFIDRFHRNPTIQGWLKVANNFIGFCVGIRASHEFVFALGEDEIQNALEVFEESFRIINVSKVNLGKFRRELSAFYIKNATELFQLDVHSLSDKFVEKTITE